MKKRQSARSRMVAAVAGGFLAGAITVAFVVWDLPNLTHPANSSDQPGAEPSIAASGKDVLSARADPPWTVPSVATVDADPVPELRRRRLELPVLDAVRRDLRESFY